MPAGKPVGEAGLSLGEVLGEAGLSQGEVLGEAGLSQGEKNSSRIEPFHISGKHSFHRRAISHDYFAPFIYHIILKKTDQCEDLGIIAGDANIGPGLPGCAYVKERQLGSVIAKSIIRLPYKMAALKHLQFKVMPDHVHLILQVLFRTEKDLDFYIDFLKETITDKYSKLRSEEISHENIFKKDIATNLSSRTVTSTDGMII